MTKIVGASNTKYENVMKAQEEWPLLRTLFRVAYGAGRQIPGWRGIASFIMMAYHFELTSCVNERPVISAEQ
jgi:hypothetical protein